MKEHVQNPRSGGTDRDIRPPIFRVGALLLLCPLYFLLLSCGPAPSGTSSQVTVLSGAGYSFSAPTALVSVGGVPWYANSIGNTLVGVSLQTGYGTSGYTPATLSNPLGISYLSSSDLSDPVAMAVDLSGNLWVVSQKNNSVVSLAISGCFYYSLGSYDCGAAAYQTKLDTPAAVAADPSGKVWVANQGNNTLLVFSSTTCAYPCPSSVYSPSGSSGYGETNYATTLYCLSGSSCTAMGSGCVLASPSAMASDSSGNIWILNSSPASLTEVVGGNASTCRNFTASSLSLDNPVALTTDTNGDLAIVNRGTKTGNDSGSVVYLPAGCTPAACTPVVLSGSSLGIDQPVSATFAQNGDLWVANQGDSSATDLPSVCLSGSSCQPIIYSGEAYPYGTPTSILPIGNTLWVLGTNALVLITPSGP